MDLDELLYVAEMEEEFASWMDEDRPEGEVWDPRTPTLLRRQAD